MKKNFLSLAGCILLCLGTGLIGSAFTTPAIGSWFIYLHKPVFSPPNWLFAPVWTLLYILMGIALFLVFRKTKENKLAALGSLIFVIHLILNASWSIIFFGFKMIPLAFTNIVLLWLLIVFLIFAFWRVDKRASMLLWPYLIWVSFASVLNYYLMILN